jgi:hypothetical protein
MYSADYNSDNAVLVALEGFLVQGDVDGAIAELPKMFGLEARFSILVVA